MGSDETIVTGLMAAGFAILHLLVSRLRFLDTTPRSKWLSFAGGVAVAYVFLHVLPDLAAHQREFSSDLGMSAVAAESLVYSLAMAGLAIFYGLERAAKISRAANRSSGEGDRTHHAMQNLHIASYSALNILVGYLLLHREEGGGWSLALFFVALALHFLTADFGIRQDNREHYDRFGRYVIAAAVLLGWALGLVIELHALLIGCAFAFLAGGIILNVLKEELPEERKSYFLPFLFGVLLYSALLLPGRHFA